MRRRELIEVRVKFDPQSVFIEKGNERDVEAVISYHDFGIAHHRSVECCPGVRSCQHVGINVVSNISIGCARLPVSELCHLVVKHD